MELARAIGCYPSKGFITVKAALGNFIFYQTQYQQVTATAHSDLEYLLQTKYGNTVNSIRLNQAECSIT